LAATDLELGIRVFCPASAEAPGQGAIPARRLLDIVRSLPDGEVRVRAFENHWVQIGSERGCKRFAEASNPSA
jgi:DNA polymerase III subunit beta